MAAGPAVPGESREGAGPQRCGGAEEKPAVSRPSGPPAAVVLCRPPLESPGGAEPVAGRPRLPAAPEVNEPRHGPSER